MLEGTQLSSSDGLLLLGLTFAENKTSPCKGGMQENEFMAKCVVVVSAGRVLLYYVCHVEFGSDLIHFVALHQEMKFTNLKGMSYRECFDVSSYAPDYT